MSKVRKLIRIFHPHDHWMGRFLGEQTIYQIGLAISADITLKRGVMSFTSAMQWVLVFQRLQHILNAPTSRNFTVTQEVQAFHRILVFSSYLH